LSQNRGVAIPGIDNIIFKDRCFGIFFQVGLTQSPVDVKIFNFKLRNRYISGCVCRRDLVGGNQRRAVGQNKIVSTHPIQGVIGGKDRHFVTIATLVLPPEIGPAEMRGFPILVY